MEEVRLVRVTADRIPVEEERIQVRQPVDGGHDARRPAGAIQRAFSNTLKYAEFIKSDSTRTSVHLLQQRNQDDRGDAEARHKPGNISGLPKEPIDRV